MGSDDYDQNRIPGAQPADGPAAAPAGWYPIDGGGQRYWDGSAWTEHISPAPGVTPPTPSTEAKQPGLPGGPETAPFSAPGAGFPPGVGDPQPVWGAAPGVPYGQGHGPMPGQNLAVVSTPDDRSMALLCHVLGIFTGILGPIILWAIKKDQSRFIDHHGKQALNFQLSMLLYWVIAFFSLIVLIGFLLIPILVVIGILLPILAAVAANKGEMYRYPLTIHFFS